MRGSTRPHPATRRAGQAAGAAGAAGAADRATLPGHLVARTDGWTDAWTDASLVEAVRDGRTDVAALDTLVRRYWPVLYGRCELLTLDRDAASDLAQETWLRVLRARRGLQPERSFPAYLVAIATNLWRDRHRLDRRAGPLAGARLASLDAPAPSDEGGALPIADVVPDPAALAPDEQLLLRLDLDRALTRLSPRSRDVLIARYVDGESAAEIGGRYGRTEQTITTWLRQAIREIARFLDAGTVPSAGTDCV